MYFKIAAILFMFSLSTTIFAIMPHDSSRLIVKFSNVKNIAQLTNISHAKKLFKNVYVVYSDDIETLHKQLSTDENVIYVERDYIGTPNKLAKVVEDYPNMKSQNSYFNDPKISRLWAFEDSSEDGISIMNSYILRPDVPREEIIVAVVDTGVDFRHEDLKENMWVNSGEIADNGIDDDGNGYIDDIHGINTLNRDTYGNATGDIYDHHGHGTHVSGTIAAVQNNHIGLAGIAKNAKIMGIRTVPGSGDEKDVDVIESFIYAAKNGAKIINCSFGKAHNEGGNAVKDAIDYIGQEYGVLVVAASGNSTDNIDKKLSYPASFDSPNLLVVASTKSNGRLSYFSNYGVQSVDLAAPGSSIYSLAPSNRYATMSGTSMASPNTAGVAAEVLSQYPGLSTYELKQALMDSVTPVRRFKTKMVSGGRVDLLRALESLSL